MIVEIMPRFMNMILYTCGMTAGSSERLPGGGVQPKSVRPELDETDRRIVLELARDARIPNNTLAERAGVAPSTCLGRVRALRERGVIRGYHADVDPAQARRRGDAGPLGQGVVGDPRVPRQLEHDPPVCLVETGPNTLRLDRSAARLV